jgi:hypothetical protein
VTLKRDMIFRIRFQESLDEQNPAASASFALVKEGRRVCTFDFEARHGHYPPLPVAWVSDPAEFHAWACHLQEIGTSVELQLPAPAEAVSGLETAAKIQGA